MNHRPPNALLHHDLRAPSPPSSSGTGLRSPSPPGPSPWILATLRALFGSGVYSSHVVEATFSEVAHGPSSMREDSYVEYRRFMAPHRLGPPDQGDGAMPNFAFTAFYEVRLPWHPHQTARVVLLS